MHAEHGHGPPGAPWFYAMKCKSWVRVLCGMMCTVGEQEAFVVGQKHALRPFEALEM